jgi:DNA polymerase III delta prime subunit
MKTIADIKRAFTLGSKWKTIYHKEFSHRELNDQGKELIIYKDKDLGEREISIAQTTQVAFKTMTKEGTFKDSWITFPKSKEVIFKDENTFTVLDYDGVPVLTYSKAN